MPSAMGRKRTGSIKQRGENSFRIRYRDASGTRHAETIKGTREDAERELAIRLGDIAKGIPVSSKPNTVLFGELCKDVVVDYKIRGLKSIDDISDRFRLHIEPAIGRRKAIDISNAILKRYIEQRQGEGASAGTINREMEAIRRAFLLAVEGRKFLFPPKVPMVEENNVRSGFFTRTEVDAVCSHLKAPIKQFVLFAFLTAWRREEIAGLQVRNVDFAAGEIRIDVGSDKNKAGRVFPMHPELRRLLKAVIPEGNVFPATKVFRMGSFRRAWKTACYKAGIPCEVAPVMSKYGKPMKYKSGKPMVKVVSCSRMFHDLRRSAIRAWIQNGMPEKTAMLLSGHKTRSVFERYNVVSRADLLQAVRYLAPPSDAAASSDKAN